MNDFNAIHDQFSSVQAVQNALRQEGLEHAQLVIGIDYTKSNEWTGKHSYGGQSLHYMRKDITEKMNPYEEAISIISRTLAPFDADQQIYTYGFGDSQSQGEAVTCLNPNDSPCIGGQDLLYRYKQVTPYIKMAGPTSFGPIIRQAMHLTQHNDNQFHILVIVADGQVTRSENNPSEGLSEWEQDTINSIVEASKLPLSIVLIGVGDGPFDWMKEFDEGLPQRKFDNFQFVNFTALMQQSGTQETRDSQFALKSLMEVPIQYTQLKKMNYMTPGQRVQVKVTKPLDPPGPQPATPHTLPTAPNITPAQHSQIQ